MTLFLFLFALAEEPKATEPEERKGFIAVASPFYTPDTGWGLGFAALHYEYDDPSKPLSDEIGIKGALTLKRQFTTIFEARNYFRQLQWLSKGEIKYSILPSPFWGIGPETLSGAEETYKPYSWEAKWTIRRKVWRELYVGPMMRFKSFRLGARKAGGLLDGKGVVGDEDYEVWAGGASASWEGRDSEFHPTRGEYGEVELLFNKARYGTFASLEADLRKFYSPVKGHVLAAQLKSKANWGEVPFDDLGSLGGNEIGRGILAGRYLDQSSWAVQGEYRSPLLWRFAGTVFVAGGQVIDSLPDVLRNPVRMTQGVGLLIFADLKEMVPFRLDVAFNSSWDMEFYFMIKEAF